ncbi:hypothetical protein J7T55_006024 [Diaporthe amygdali]|uniref:uncharacterized protein n=1 Tax=Phomopsis amygdali TaxID=1214568 RepID=UPI0022FE9C8F|nr:uncharacterized protein J7T55_006024 [Diaporthe amygdali]KAJ0124684.1 hypothetical protein J7T55_006024 [Diaporthe amygdali]
MSTNRKAIGKRDKKELTPLLTVDLPTGSPEPTKSIDTLTMAEETTMHPSLPKETISQYTLSVIPQLGVDIMEMEDAIRNIQSPCQNVLWSSFEKQNNNKRRSGAASTTANRSGAAPRETLEIKVIYNDCSRHKTAPYSCRKNRREYGAKHGSVPLHSKTMKIGDVLDHVRGMASLVAACEVVANRSWALNAVSHGGMWGR